MTNIATRRVNRSGSHITTDERAAIIAMRRETPTITVIRLAAIFHRARETIRLILYAEGLLSPGEKTVPAFMLAKDSSPIVLVGITDPLRIDWYRRKFGAHRIAVSEAASAQLRAYRDDAHV